MYTYIWYFFFTQVGGKRKGKRTRKGKQDKNELFKALEIKIGIEREEFDSCYEEFMKICPKVRFRWIMLDQIEL